MNDPIVTSEEQLKKLITQACDDAVQKAITRSFRDVGIIAHTDEAVDERRRDFQFLHDFRMSSESVKNRIGVVVLLSAMSGLVAIFISGFRIWTKQ